MKYREGAIIKVKVTSIKHYGAFIETKDKVQGLIHISEISNNFIVDINYYLKVGEIIEIKILSIKDCKINATLNFASSKNRNIKNIHFIKKCNFKYNFDTIARNINFWKRKALREIDYSKK